MNQQAYHELCMNMKHQYLHELQQGSKIIFLDEAIFSASTMLTKSWCNAKNNIMLPDRRARLKPYALIAGISADAGLECSYLHLNSIKQE